MKKGLVRLDEFLCEIPDRSYLSKIYQDSTRISPLQGQLINIEDVISM